ncbi:hypothetical protein [Rhizobium rhizosphaerae]|uniref:hypothetical protein n=1 Tax=Xaviernesmea rhizosphaerae TaxID=1672749 RepID=UPI000A53F2C1|nr:hypothetical protein [Xaviernesmea rhizosphaerae]
MASTRARLAVAYLVGLGRLLPFALPAAYTAAISSDGTYLVDGEGNYIMGGI